MTTGRAKRLLARGWVYVPAASSPIGGGLIKLGRGSTWAAVAVGVAPYAICGLLLTVFVIGYLAALLRYLCTRPAEQEAMERLITISANAIVSILTLTVITLPAGEARSSHPPLRYVLVMARACYRSISSLQLIEQCGDTGVDPPSEMNPSLVRPKMLLPALLQIGSKVRLL